MISSKKLSQLARKWRSALAIGRKRISFRRTNSKKDSRDTNPSIKKGHFVVYTTNGGRFMIPLSYLNNGVVRELLGIAEEEFGIPGEGPIMLPTDAPSMAYVVSLIRRGLSSEQEKALLMSFIRMHRKFMTRIHGKKKGHGYNDLDPNHGLDPNHKLDPESKPDPYIEP